MASIPCKTNPMGKSKEPYFSLIVKPGILGDMEYGFTPYWNEGGYCRVLDWGDGVAENAVTSGTVLIHTYSVAGTYKIKIVGDCWKVIFGKDTSYAPLIYDSNLKWDFLGNITDASEMFYNSQNAVFTVYNLPRFLRIGMSAFYNCRKASFYIQKLPDTLTDSAFMFMYCINMYYLGSLSKNINNSSSMLRYCTNLSISLDDLAKTAPENDWESLTGINNMFDGCPLVTGSRSAFLAKCPNVTNTTDAFRGTNTTE